MNTTNSYCAIALFALVFMLSWSVDALASRYRTQDVFIGYTGSYSKEPLGACFGWFDINTGGWFVDIKFHLDFSGKGTDYTGIISQREAEGFFRDSYTEKDGWLGCNFCHVLNFNRWIARCAGFYAGLGLAFHRYYKLYNDPMSILDPSGLYQVTTENDIGLNILGGFLIRVKSVFLQVGIETLPRGLTLGCGYMGSLPY